MITKAIISDGDKYLIAEIGAGAYTGLWDFIGTFLPEDKTPEDFLKEFVEANLGLKIKVGEILARYDAESSHSYDTVFYLCELVDGTVNIACLGYRVAEWVKKEDFKSYSFESRNHVAIEALLNIE
jgi:hypothetical protein